MKKLWDVTVTARNGRPKIIKFCDGRTGGVFENGILAVKNHKTDTAIQIGNTKLTANSWDKKGLSDKELSQFKKWAEENIT